MTIFNLVYQQKINSGNIVSIEALLRPINGVNVEEYVKNHPNPIDLDIRVIKRVVNEIITFKIPVIVSINVCYHSFVNDNFIDFCLAILPSFNVRLELTEYNEITNMKKLHGNINRLRKANLSISLDDFGKNFSNTNLISEIFFDQIKIDKSLIDNIETNFSKYKHLSFITGKIKEFGITDIVYEGVEKKEQMELIKIFNSHPTIQGYLYSKPLPIKDIAFTNTFNETHKKRCSSNDSNLERSIYDLVLSRNDSVINNNIINSDPFKNIFSHVPEETISNFREVYYSDESKLVVNSVFSMINNSDKMVVIRNSQGIAIFENKKHAAFFGCSIVGMSLKNVLTIFPSYKHCIHDDNQLFNSKDNYSIEKESFDNINYLTVRQKVSFNNDSFIFTTVYEESEGSFSNKDPLTSCLLRDSINNENNSLFYNGKIIAFLDLNGFKAINDSYGHYVGDQTLLDFVTLLRMNLRNTDDKIIRYGGDEFVILFNATNLSSIGEKLDNINKKVKNFFEEKNILLSFSYGIKVNISNNIEETILAADKQMYLQKTVYKKRSPEPNGLMWNDFIDRLNIGLDFTDLSIVKPK